MGGLASINYGTDYAVWNPGKKVQIITVDTPYLPNNYAKAVWYDNLDSGRPVPGKPGITMSWSESLGNQIRGYAHRDLGGVPIENEDGDDGAVAIEAVKNKWNSHMASNLRRKAELYAIAVSINKYGSVNFMSVGDGVVDIYSQQGKTDKGEVQWDNVNKQEVIYGNSSLAGLGDKGNPYHHSNTPLLKEVAEQIDTLIRK
jgi:hypothetical protein